MELQLLLYMTSICSYFQDEVCYALSRVVPGRPYGRAWGVFFQTPMERCQGHI